MSKHRAPDDPEPVAETPAPERPVLRIVRGEPTPEELAVLTAVLSASGAGAGDADPPTAAIRGRWNDPAHLHRGSWPVGPGGWRSSR